MGVSSTLQIKWLSALELVINVFQKQFRDAKTKPSQRARLERSIAIQKLSSSEIVSSGII